MSSNSIRRQFESFRGGAKPLEPETDWDTGRLIDEISGISNPRLVSRRQFLRTAAIVAGGSFVVLACGPQATGPPPTQAPTAVPEGPPSSGSISPDDPRIEAGPVEFESGDMSLMGYLSRPTGAGPHPGVVVIHENRGMLPHFPDVTRRLAAEGYAALAVDLLSRKGGTGSFSDTDKMRDALRAIPRENLVADANAGVTYLQSLSYVQGDRIGAMGFCFGGSIVWMMAVTNPKLKAAVPFYGGAPPLEQIPNLQVPVLGIYGANDDRINAGVPDLEAALKREGKTYKFNTYADSGHAFFNDTGRRYNPQAAGEAWQETLGWFEQYLRR